MVWEYNQNFNIAINTDYEYGDNSIKIKNISIELCHSKSNKGRLKFFYFPIANETRIIFQTSDNRHLEDILKKVKTNPDHHMMIYIHQFNYKAKLEIWNYDIFGPIIIFKPIEESINENIVLKIKEAIESNLFDISSIKLHGIDENEENELWKKRSMII